MSDSEESYTVVDELEEGEIVENPVPVVSSNSSRLKRKRKSLDGNCVATDSSDRNSHHKGSNKSQNSKFFAVPAAYVNSGGSRGGVCRKPVSHEAIVVVPQPPPPPRQGTTHCSKGHLKSHVPKKSKLPPVQTEVVKNRPSTSKQRAKFRNTLLGISEKCVKSSSPREAVARNEQPSSVPNLGVNSSYDDLLKHHREIQLALAKLEKEHRKSKTCSHRAGGDRRRSAGGRERDGGSNSHDRQRQGKVVSGKTQPKVIPKPELLQVRIPVVTSRIPADVSSLSPRDKKKTNAPHNDPPLVKMIPAEERSDSNLRHVDELEQLRLSVMLSVPSKTSDSVEFPKPFYEGCDKENTVPNGGECSSALSVSSCRDDYSVVDMEVDDDSCFDPEIIVSYPPPAPCSQRSLPRPSRNFRSNASPLIVVPIEEEEDIDAMRQRLIMSLNKARNQEPDSTTCPVGELENSRIYNRNSTRSSPERFACAPGSGGSGASPVPDSSGVALSSPSHHSSSSDASNVPPFQPTSICLLDSPSLSSSPIPNDFPSIDPSVLSSLNQTSSSERSSDRVSEAAFAELQPPSPPVVNGAISNHNCREMIPAKSSSSQAISVPGPLSNVVNNNRAVTNNCPPATKIPPGRKKIVRNPVLQPWPYIKQKPVIINLGEDSTDDETESDSEDRSSSFITFEEIIRSEKMKASFRQSEPASSNAGRESGAQNREMVLTTNGLNPSTSSSLAVSVRNDSSTVGDHVPQPVETVPPPPPNQPAQPCDSEPDKPCGDIVVEYNLICKKLALASETYKKEQQILAMKKILANKKKSAFINSQLVVQRLKEQLAAAEKVKNTNMRMMFVANAELETVQGSMLKKALLLKQMREQCHIVEEQISSSMPFPLDVILNSK